MWPPRAIDERSPWKTAVSSAEARDLYRGAVCAKRFDERALALQRRGWTSGYPPFGGQEASQAAGRRSWRASRTGREQTTADERPVPRVADQSSSEM